MQNKAVSVIFVEFCFILEVVITAQCCSQCGVYVTFKKWSCYCSPIIISTNLNDFFVAVSRASLCTYMFSYFGQLGLAAFPLNIMYLILKGFRFNLLDWNHLFTWNMAKSISWVRRLTCLFHNRGVNCKFN